MTADSILKDLDNLRDRRALIPYEEYRSEWDRLWRELRAVDGVVDTRDYFDRQRAHKRLRQPGLRKNIATTTSEYERLCASEALEVMEKEEAERVRCERIFEVNKPMIDAMTVDELVTYLASPELPSFRVACYANVRLRSLCCTTDIVASEVGLSTSGARYRLRNVKPVVCDYGKHWTRFYWHPSVVERIKTK